MKTVTFVYTDGITFKATNVTSITNHMTHIEYSQEVLNESMTVGGINLRMVETDDLLYAVVKDNVTKEVTIIPGLYESFDVVPKGDAVRRQVNIEAEAARVAADRAAKAPAREAKEQEKFNARRAARKAEWQAAHGVVPQIIGKRVNTAPAAPVTPTATESTAETGVFAALQAAGINDRDLAVLREILK